MVITLAGVLAVEAADRGAVGALAPSLEQAFGFGHAGLGLLAGAVTLVAATATIPAGIAVDRIPRVPLLSFMVLTWGLAMAVAGAATSFEVLLGARLFLGGVTAVAYPAVASLTGDLFERRQRGSALGRIRTGEMVGVGAGLVVAGSVIAVTTWRAVFWLLGASAIGLFLVLRHLPEPSRGGEKPTTRTPGVHTGADRLRCTSELEPATNPETMTLVGVTRYVLGIRTNVLLMFGGSLGDFFFSGLQIFLVSFVIHQYRIEQYAAALLVPVVGAGALAGLLVGGRLGDRWMQRGQTSARVLLAAVAFVAVGPVLLPLLFLHSIVAALPFMLMAGALLAIPIPTLDASRLDIVHPLLWGRAEAVRTIVRTVAQSAGPIVFGLLADHLAGGGAAGLRATFFVMIPMLALNGIVLLAATRTYPHDVAEATAFFQATSRSAADAP